VVEGVCVAEERASRGDGEVVVYAEVYAEYGSVLGCGRFVFLAFLFY
jgi:hypothetical protein